MPRVDVTVKVSLDLEDSSQELVKVAGREIIADLSSGLLGHNENVTDIDISKVEATVAVKVNCMPEEEISELAH